MKIDAQGTEFIFNGQAVGKITQYNLVDGTVRVAEHRPMDGKVVRLPTNVDFGYINVTLYRDTTDVGQIEIASGIRNRSVVPCFLKLASGALYQFEGFGISLPVTGVIDDVNTCNCVIGIKSDFTEVP